MAPRDLDARLDTGHGQNQQLDGKVTTLEDAETAAHAILHAGGDGARRVQRAWMVARMPALPRAACGVTRTL